MTLTDLGRVIFHAREYFNKECEEKIYGHSSVYDGQYDVQVVDILLASLQYGIDETKKDNGE